MVTRALRMGFNGRVIARDRSFNTSGKTPAEWHHRKIPIKLAGNRGLYCCAEILFLHLQVHGA
jgi:hypothetical protein